MLLDVWAREVFSWLCHQDASRSFAPGGAVLSLCARCVGVYVGFVLALPVMAMMRFLGRTAGMWLGGVFVLQVAVFGFGLIQHGATVRAISGQLFAVGVVYFLFMGIWAGRSQKDRKSAPWLLRTFLAVAQAVVGLQLLLRLPWGWVGTLLNGLALAGLGVFCVLTATFLVRMGPVVLGRRRV